MAFITEPTAYEKTELSDLQGSWQNLRRSVCDNFGFSDTDKLLFHIDEAINCESARNLTTMKSTFLLVLNIAKQSDAPDEVIELIEDVRDDQDTTLMLRN